MAGFTFRLYVENGEDVGSFTTAVPNWDLGMTFQTGQGVKYRIANIVPELGEKSEFDGVFVVTPLELAEPG